VIPTEPNRTLGGPAPGGVNHRTHWVRVSEHQSNPVNQETREPRTHEPNGFNGSRVHVVPCAIGPNGFDDVAQWVHVSLKPYTFTPVGQNAPFARPRTLDSFIVRKLLFISESLKTCDRIKVTIDATGVKV
jgi:hypothetical protein